MLLYRNYRNITVPFASSHSGTMLLEEKRGLIAEKLYCSIWRNILTGFSIQIESGLCQMVRNRPVRFCSCKTSSAPFRGKFSTVFTFK